MQLNDLSEGQLKSLKSLMEQEEDPDIFVPYFEKLGDEKTILKKVSGILDKHDETGWKVINNEHIRETYADSDEAKDFVVAQLDNKKDDPDAALEILRNRELFEWGFSPSPNAGSHAIHLAFNNSKDYNKMLDLVKDEWLVNRGYVNPENAGERILPAIVRDALKYNHVEEVEAIVSNEQLMSSGIVNMEKLQEEFAKHVKAKVERYDFEGAAQLVTNPTLNQSELVNKELIAGHVADLVIKELKHYDPSYDPTKIPVISDSKALAKEGIINKQVIRTKVKEKAKGELNGTYVDAGTELLTNPEFIKRGFVEEGDLEEVFDGVVKAAAAEGKAGYVNLIIHCNSPARHVETDVKSAKKIIEVEFEDRLNSREFKALEGILEASKNEKLSQYIDLKALQNIRDGHLEEIAAPKKNSWNDNINHVTDNYGEGFLEPIPQEIGEKILAQGIAAKLFNYPSYEVGKPEEAQKIENEVKELSQNPYFNPEEVGCAMAPYIGRNLARPQGNSQQVSNVLECKTFQELGIIRDDQLKAVVPLALSRRFEKVEIGVAKYIIEKTSLAKYIDKTDERFAPYLLMAELKEGIEAPEAT